MHLRAFSPHLLATEPFPLAITMHISATSRGYQKQKQTASLRVPLRSVLSPSLPKCKTVRFQFPSQASKVRDISNELDTVATTISLLRMRSSPQLTLPASPRLYDAPISLSRLKHMHRIPSKDDLYTRKQTLVLLPDFKSMPRRSNPLHRS
jgi:hypothetical protein